MTLNDYKRKDKIKVFEYCVRQPLNCKKKKKNEDEDESIGNTKAFEKESFVIPREQRLNRNLMVFGQFPSCELIDNHLAARLESNNAIIM